MQSEIHQSKQTYQITQLLEQQKKAFLQTPYPTEKLRKQQLLALKISLLKHKEKLYKAVSADFGCRSKTETLFSDILRVVATIDHTIKHLRNWMKPAKRSVSMRFQPAINRIMYQPLGVIGIISPWNYPVLLSLGPLVEVIAAGNRAMIKPSEHTPYTNRIISEILEETFSSDEVSLVSGDSSFAKFFSELPFDHLIFTGSSAVGKLVMASAAKNLTPVTLELGGKSPVLLCDDIDVELAVNRILFGKCLNAGQTCVAPDYILCPESKLDALISEFKTQFIQLYPQNENKNYTSIINDQHFKRLQSYLADASQKGANVISLAGASTNTRYMPLQLITHTHNDMAVMQQEIFGPILPIISYQKLSEAISFIQSKARPLAFYLFSNNVNIQNQVLKQTHAGGVCINDTVSHVAQLDLPFGGVGASGMGQYRAHEGFKTFSANKPIHKKSRHYSKHANLFPFGKIFYKLIYHFFVK